MEGTVYGSLASELCLGHLGAVGRLDSYVVAGDHAKRVLQVKTRACSLGKTQSYALLGKTQTLSAS